MNDRELLYDLLEIALTNKKVNSQTSELLRRLPVVSALHWPRLSSHVISQRAYAVIKTGEVGARPLK